MNAAVAGYREAVRAVALRVSRSRAAIRVGAEFDDLEQEGLIQVWQSLGRGITPATNLLQLRMIDYIRWIGLQTDVPRKADETDDGTQHVSYETMLPMDEFRASETRS